jgi:hypothetical protein
MHSSQNEQVATHRLGQTMTRCAWTMLHLQQDVFASKFRVLRPPGDRWSRLRNARVIWAETGHDGNPSIFAIGLGLSVDSFSICPRFKV